MKEIIESIQVLQELYSSDLLLKKEEASKFKEYYFPIEYNYLKAKNKEEYKQRLNQYKQINCNNWISKKEIEELKTKYIFPKNFYSIESLSLEEYKHWNKFYLYIKKHSLFVSKEMYPDKSHLDCNYYEYMTKYVKPNSEYNELLKIAKTIPNDSLKQYADGMLSFNEPIHLENIKEQIKIAKREKRIRWLKNNKKKIVITLLILLIYFNWTSILIKYYIWNFKNVNSPIQRRIESAENLREIRKKSVVPALIEALKDNDSDVRYNVAKALGNIGSDAKEAVPALIQALKDNRSWVHRSASEALVKIGKEAVPALIQALKDDNRDVRNNVIDILVKIGKEAVPALIEALKDNDEDVHYYVIEALGKIGSYAKEAVPTLIETLKDNRSWVRRCASEALGKIGSNPKEAIPALKELSEKESDYFIRNVAEEAIRKIEKGR